MSDEFLVRDTRLPGHFWADNEVYDVYAPKLGGYAFAVYMALCRKAINKSGECAISMSELARDLDIAKSTVHQAVTRIVQLGLAHLLSPGGPRIAAVYVLADVKSLVDPVHAQQLRLMGKPTISVRIANEGETTRSPSDQQRSYSERNSETTFAQRTPNKESKTSTRLSNTKPQMCALHPDSGLTQWGTCWACYSEKYRGPSEDGAPA